MHTYSNVRFKKPTNSWRRSAVPRYLAITATMVAVAGAALSPSLFNNVAGVHVGANAKVITKMGEDGCRYHRFSYPEVNFMSPEVKECPSSPSMR